MSKPSLTQAYLRECLRYDPETGVFTWLDRPRRHFKRSNEWVTWNKVCRPRVPTRINARGYEVISLGRAKYRAHRLAWLYMTGDWPEGEIDHVDHNKANNKFANLRAVSVQENHKNMRLSRANTSGRTGVSWDKSSQKWEAHISVDSRKKSLGRYAEFDKASLVRAEAEKKYGYHENHGLCQS